MNRIGKYYVFCGKLTKINHLLDEFAACTITSIECVFRDKYTVSEKLDYERFPKTYFGKHYAQHKGKQFF